MQMTNKSGETERQLGKGMIFAAWILALGLLTWLFSGFLEYQRNPNRQVEASADGRGNIEVTLQRNRAGHYLAAGQINGQPVVFLLDTGATDVAVPETLANRLGLERKYRSVSRTANGNITTWSTRLDSVDLGGIRRPDVRATILPNMTGNEVLLGMSFLKHLELIQRGDTLTLRDLRR